MLLSLTFTILLGILASAQSSRLEDQGLEPHHNHRVFRRSPVFANAFGALGSERLSSVDHGKGAWLPSLNHHGAGRIIAQPRTERQSGALGHTITRPLLGKTARNSKTRATPQYMWDICAIYGAFAATRDCMNLVLNVS